MQIHELNTFPGKPGSTDFIPVDSGFDTSKISATELLKYQVNKPLNGEIPYDGDPGQLLRTKGDGSTEWVDFGNPTDAQTAQAVSDWLDAHPEATTTVQDGAITFEKLSPSLEDNLWNMDEEFLALGGQFGAVSDAQKTINTSALMSLFTKYNGLVFKYHKEIETLNLSITIKERSVFKNIYLKCTYTETKNYTIGSNGNYPFVYIDNVYLSSNKSSYCKYGVYFGSTNHDVFAPYATIQALTISNYIYSIVWFGWSCSGGRIEAYNCTFAPIIMGTSMSIDVLDGTGCTYGVSLGVFPDENGAAQGTISTCYLLYSDINVITVDGNPVVAPLLLGYASYVNINSYATEAIHQYSIYNYGEFMNVNFGIIRIMSTPTVALTNDTTNFERIIVGQVFGEYIYSGGKFPLRPLRIDNYLGRLTNYQNMWAITPDASVSMASEYCMQDGINTGGVTANRKYYLTHMNAYGILTNGEELVIRLRGSTFPESSAYDTNREILFLGKFIISDADQYNSKKVSGETMLALARDLGSTSGLVVSNPITNITFSLEMIDGTPSVIVTPPAVQSDTYSYNYVYMLECVGGGYTKIYKRTRA